MKAVLTLVDLKERLTKLDEVYLLELLQLTSEDLVDRYEDIIEDRFDDLQAELEEINDGTESRSDN